MKSQGHNRRINYIDDLIYVNLPSNIHNSYQNLLSLLAELDLEVSHAKLVPASTSVVCLGILMSKAQFLFLMINCLKLNSYITTGLIRNFV